LAKVYIHIFDTVSQTEFKREPKYGNTLMKRSVPRPGPEERSRISSTIVATI